MTYVSRALVEDDWAVLRAIRLRRSRRQSLVVRQHACARAGVHGADVARAGQGIGGTRLFVAWAGEAAVGIAGVYDEGDGSLQLVSVWVEPRAPSQGSGASAHVSGVAPRRRAGIRNHPPLGHRRQHRCPHALRSAWLHVDWQLQPLPSNPALEEHELGSCACTAGRDNRHEGHVRSPAWVMLAARVGCDTARDDRSTRGDRRAWRVASWRTALRYPAPRRAPAAFASRADTRAGHHPRSSGDVARQRRPHPGPRHRQRAAQRPEPGGRQSGLQPGHRARWHRPAQPTSMPSSIRPPQGCARSSATRSWPGRRSELPGRDHPRSIDGVPQGQPLSNVSSLAYYTGLRDHVRVVAGHWPGRQPQRFRLDAHRVGARNRHARHAAASPRWQRVLLQPPTQPRPRLNLVRTACCDMAAHRSVGPLLGRARARDRRTHRARQLLPDR